MSMLVVALFVAIGGLLYYWSVRKYSYWRKKRVPHPKPVPFLGNYVDYMLMRKYMGDVSQELCRQFPNEPYFGAYYGTEPALVLQDPEVIKLVFTKDFYYFHSRDLSEFNHNEVSSQNLFFTQGDKWKVIRQNLTPLFSSAKMKNMFYLIAKCGHALDNMLDEERTMSQVLDAKTLMMRYTMDCIGSTVFGLETKVMEKSKTKNTFLLLADIIFATSKFMGLKWIVRTAWPSIFYFFRMKYFPVEIDKFFKNLMMDVFEKREFKSTTRHDFVDLVLSLKQNNYIVGDRLNPKGEDNKKIQLELTDDVLVAQCVVFFAAGFETSASTLSCALFELAKDQESQRKAQAEVDEYLRRHNNKLGYECVTELPYIEACLNEAMRLYPVLAVLTREVVEDYTFPSGLQVNKGLRVHLPVYHLHRHPDHFPDPDTFRPDRFYQSAKEQVKPYTFFPFGEGPRQCLGMRFSRMQTTVGLITVLKKYRVELAEGTPSKLEFYPHTFLTHPKFALNLKFIPRDGWQQRVYTD